LNKKSKWQHDGPTAFYTGVLNTHFSLAFNLSNDFWLFSLLAFFMVFKRSRRFLVS
jgi:hypothetical protein